MYVKIQSEDLWDKILDEVTDQPSLHATFSKTWEDAQKIVCRYNFFNFIGYIIILYYIYIIYQNNNIA